MADEVAAVAAPVENTGVEQSTPVTAEGSAQVSTSQDKAQVDAVTQLMSTQDLPKGTTYFKDKSGKLQFVVPINGKQYQTDFAGLVKGFNLNQAGYQKLEEGKAIEKQYTSFIENLKKNPEELWAFAERVGLDPVKLAEGRLQKAVDEANMTEEQKDLAKFKREKELFEKEKEEYKKTAEQKQIEAESAKYQAKYSDDLVNALKKHNISQDKNSFVSMKGIAKAAVQKVTQSLEKGVDMSMEDAVNEARQEVTAYIQDFLESVEDNHILDALPPKLLDRILKASLNRKVGTPTTNTVGTQVALKQTSTSNNKNKGKVNINDYFSSLK